MRYRIYKTSRILKPYKVQVWDGSWSDCVRIKLYHEQAIVSPRYFWTARGALKVIQEDCTAESMYE